MLQVDKCKDKEKASKSKWKEFVVRLYRHFQCLWQVLVRSSTFLLPGPGRYYTTLQRHITAPVNTREAELDT